MKFLRSLLLSLLVLSFVCTAFAAEISPEEKNRISHRGKALEVFDGKLREYLVNHK